MSLARNALALPPNFSDSLVAVVSSPTALAFLPDGRLLVTTQGGALLVVSSGLLLPEPALTIPAVEICATGERGMLGISVDPAYPASPYLYIYYTANLPVAGCVNRLSRFTLPDGSNAVASASELVLVDNMPSPAGNHNGGDVKFGRDGTLFATIGDGGCDYAADSGCAGSNDASRDLQTLTGKLLRINKDGSIPADNPFQGAGTARCNVTGRTTAGNKCQETFAWGFRNPFRFSLDPNSPTNRIVVNDVGQGAWEEIDDIVPGGDYGWNCREGAHANSSLGKCSPSPPLMIDPIFEYAHTGNVPGTSVAACGSITGSAFVPNGTWPGFDGAYLFADFNCGAIFRLTTGGSTWSASDFASGVGGVVSLLFGPFGISRALYYTTYAGGGQVRRIAFANDPPIPAISSPEAAAKFRVGQTMTLTGSATDVQDGTLPDAALSWTVLLHQGALTIPYFGPATGNSLTFVAPAPPDFAAAANSFLEIRLTATDSLGVSTTVTQSLQPNAFPILVATNPAGLQVTVNGTALTGPTFITAWEAWNLTVAAASPQPGPGAKSWDFNSWTDGGALSHVFVVPAAASGLTAGFVPEGGLSFYTVVPCRALDTRTAGAPVAAEGTLNLTLAGACGIPAGAMAVAANITVWDPGATGHLRAVPPGLYLPPTSTLNFGAGQVRANFAVLSLLGDPAGVVDLTPVMATGTVHVIVDVSGYFK
jgi:glucose/arabinose dehydrogenase